MLMLLFSVGNDRYALECKQVLEVVPLIGLKKLHHAPDYVAGLFNYRSYIVPVIDLGRLIQGTPCCRNLSTRIILVNYQSGSGLGITELETPEFASLQSRTHQPSRISSQETISSQIFGLMAERVTETIYKPETELVDPGITVNTAPYLGKIITTEQEMIQCIQLNSLLPQLQSAYLLPAEEQ